MHPIQLLKRLEAYLDTRVSADVCIHIMRVAMVAASAANLFWLSLTLLSLGDSCFAFVSRLSSRSVPLSRPLYAKKNDKLIQKLQREIETAQNERWQIELEILSLQQSYAEKKLLLDSVDTDVAAKQLKLEQAQNAAAAAAAANLPSLPSLASASLLAVPVAAVGALAAGRAALQKREELRLEEERRREEEERQQLLAEEREKQAHFVSTS